MTSERIHNYSTKDRKGRLICPRRIKQFLTCLPDTEIVEEFEEKGEGARIQTAKIIAHALDTTLKYEYSAGLGSIPGEHEHIDVYGIQKRIEMIQERINGILQQ